MTKRSYFKSSIVELEKAFDSSKGDKKALEALYNELKFRDTYRASSLRSKIEKLLGVKADPNIRKSTTESVGVATPNSQPTIAAVERSDRDDRESRQGQSHTVAIGAGSTSQVGEDTAVRGGEDNPEMQLRGSEISLTPEHQRLLDLVEYVRHMVQLAERPVFSLKEYKQLCYHESALKNRTGIHHDLSDEDGAIWLKIDRLNRIEPPMISERMQGWIVVGRDPFRSPAIQAIRTATIQKVEAERLVSEGKLIEADVQPALKARPEQKLCDVIYRLERNPEIKRAIDDYISGPWTKWSELEKPRRETIAIYDAFFSTQQTIQSEGAEQPLEIVWGIGLARWKIQEREVDHPLLEQLVELYVDPQDGAITIRPRSADPQIAIKPFFALENAGAEIVLKFGREFLAGLPEEMEFSPFVRTTFEPVLRQAVAHLDKSGTYYPDEAVDNSSRDVPDVSGDLIVTDTWTIYARRRSDNFFVGDLERLKAAIKECEDLPGPARRLVTEPADTGGYRPTLVNLGDGFKEGAGGSGGGGSISSADVSIEGTSPEDFFFPKPFNDEQVSIVRQLSKADGAVVQGPPGTGKTHTIANIICHYLATGKRVLVTSKGEGALAVLRDHIPEGIRDLAISLLTSEREGLKQLEAAVTLLANTASQMDPRQLEREIVGGQRHILELQRHIDEIEAELNQWAAKHLKRVEGLAGSAALLPMDLAKKIHDDRAHHVWFPDSLAPNAQPGFSSEDIQFARDARRQLGADIIYLEGTLPSQADLPDVATIGAIHENLVSAARLQETVRKKQVPELSLAARDAINRATKLQRSIEHVVEYFDAVADCLWLHRIMEVWRHQGPTATEVQLFGDVVKSMESIVSTRAEFVLTSVVLPDGAHVNQEFCEAVERASKGTRPFGLLPFGKSEIRTLFASVRIAGKRPGGVDEWDRVHAYVVWRHHVSAFVIKWKRLVPELGLPDIEDQGDETARWIASIHDKINKGTSVVQEHGPLISTELIDLFPYKMNARQILTARTEAAEAVEVIKLNLAKHRLAASRNRLTDLLGRLKKADGPIVANILKFVREIGNESRDIHSVMDQWQAFCHELDRLRQLRPAMDALERVAGLVAESGAVKWATALRTIPVREPEDAWTPAGWRESWDWACLNSYLHEIDGRDRIRHLSSQLMRFDNELKRAFSEVVRLRTFLGLKKNITDRVAAALILFTNAIRNIGRGTGIRARRFRRDARDASERSASAIPCWIMPTWRVAESLPASLGSFDLVIVDEASQSDITALPALIRGKKLLIVGDDKQVSPTASFIEERQILQLRHNYLQGQPFGVAMLPGGSLYTLAQAMFPAQRILLREHFRCVEPIIRFSFQFYTESLVPLRLPKPSERLDPPLIDVHVANGRKDSKQINMPEASAIVDEITQVVNDSKYAGRSIGVVSLIGAKQAHYIQSLLLERIGEEAFLRHNITCGDPATFQGKERDIMFISMVACPLTKTALTSLPFQQRFNVALSRARDRQYLFRSVTEEILSPDDLKAKVIRHFRAPMGDMPTNVPDLIDLCDSEFERDVYRRLIALGYRVTPQVKVGSYLIDLVVEGDNDRRIAIELDGDKYHTPEKWADDFARQRVLERVGWRFWRCWGSSYALNPDSCIEDLVTTLKSAQIDPIGGRAAVNVYTEHRVIGLPQEVERDKGSDAENQEYVAMSARVEEELLVKAGDRVLISYNDEPSRQYTLTLSATKHDPDALVINASKPLAQALIGYGEDDEVDIPAGGSTRKVTILKIDRQAQA